MCGAPADGQKKEPFHKGKSSKSAKKKQRTHGENGSKLILRFCVHLLCLHRSVSFSGGCLVSNYFSIEARNLSMPAASFFAEKVCAPKPIFLATLPKKPPWPAVAGGQRGVFRKFFLQSLVFHCTLKFGCAIIKGRREGRRCGRHSTGKPYINRI